MKREVNKPKIILISGKAQSGKDTFAKFFKERARELGKKCFIIKYGDLLKYVLKTYYGWNGEKDEQGRYMLQHIGTDVLRANSPNVWVNCVIELVRAIAKGYDYVLIPDTRFVNEIDQWWDTEFDYITVKVERKNADGSEFDNGLTEEQKKHISETALDDYLFDYTIMNDNTEELFKDSSYFLTENILSQRGEEV